MEGNDMMLGYALADDNRNSNDGFGNGAWSWMWIIIILALFGWGGRGGFGGFGNGAGSCNPCATTADLAGAFNFSQLDNGIRSIQNGICDSTFALSNAITTGFSTAELARCQQQAALMQQLNTMSFQAQDCCCQTQRAIDGVRYDMATGFCAIQNTANNNTRDIIQSTHNDTDRVLAALNQMESNRQAEKIEALRLENQTLKFQASQTAQNAFITANQDAQTAELIRRIVPTPTPAYVVPNPNCCYGGGYGYGGYGNCGCNNGCNC